MYRRPLWSPGDTERAYDRRGLTGYCMGAAMALRTAGTYPDRVAAAAGFHGGNLASDQPNSPHLLAGNVTAHHPDGEERHWRELMGLLTRVLPPG